MNTRHTTIRRLLPAALAIAVGLGMTGCGGDDDSSSDTTVGGTDPPTAPATDPPEEPATDEADGEGEAEGEGEVITVALSDFAFGGLPETVPVGTRLQIENVSESELHELVAIRIPDDEDRSVEELLALPDDELDVVFGSTMPAMVLLAPPGGPQIEAVGDGTFTEPGRYAVVCFIPTGADPEAYLAAGEGDGPPDVEGGPPHIAHGMHAEVVVG